MTYATTITLISLEGGQRPGLQGDLWQIEHFLVGNPRNVEVSIESVSVAPTAPLTLGFTGGPGQQSQGRSIGLSLQEAAGITDGTGWWFRSGRFSDDLPAAGLEVVLPGSVRFTPAQLAAALPAVPFAAGSFTITALTLSPMADGTIVFGATGGDTGNTYSYSRPLRIQISTSISNAPTEAFTLEFAGPSTAILAPIPPVSLYAPAPVDNATPAVDLIARVVMANLQAMVVAGANALLVSAGLTGAGASGLPAGVVLSLRRAAVTAGGVAFVVALGGFGGVLAKYPPLPPPQPTPPRKPCFIATAALSAEAPEVRVLQRWRDEVLRKSPAGRAFVAGYERLSPPVARYIAARPALRRAARELLIRPAARAAAAALRSRAGH